MKTCKKCDIKQPLEAYRYRKDKQRHNAQCNDCERIARNERRRKQKQTLLIIKELEIWKKDKRIG